ncbi:MAG: hypothetical protein ACREQM_04415 [Candidatus Dormibacteraceae bacterium]
MNPLTLLLPSVVPELTFLLVVVTGVIALLCGPTSRRVVREMTDQTCRSTGAPASDLRRAVRALVRSRPVPAHLAGLTPLALPIAISALQVDARAFGRIRRVAPILLPIAGVLQLLSVVASAIGGEYLLPAGLVGICALGILFVEFVYLWMAPAMISRRLYAVQGLRPA